MSRSLAKGFNSMMILLSSAKAIIPKEFAYVGRVKYF
jgi:hypothetical protein